MVTSESRKDGLREKEKEKGQVKALIKIMIDTMKNGVEKQYRLSKCLMENCAKEDELIKKSYTINKEMKTLLKNMNVTNSSGLIELQSRLKELTDEGEKIRQERLKNQEKMDAYLKCKVNKCQKEYEEVLNQSISGLEKMSKQMASDRDKSLRDIIRQGLDLNKQLKDAVKKQDVPRINKLYRKLDEYKGKLRKNQNEIKNEMKKEVAKQK